MNRYTISVLVVSLFLSLSVHNGRFENEPTKTTDGIGTAFSSAPIMRNCSGSGSTLTPALGGFETMMETACAPQHDSSTRIKGNEGTGGKTACATRHEKQESWAIKRQAAVPKSCPSR